MNRELGKVTLTELEKLSGLLVRSGIFLDQDFRPFVVFDDKGNRINSTKGYNLKRGSYQTKIINFGEIVEYSGSEELNQERIKWMIQTLEDFALASERLSMKAEEIAVILKNDNHLVISDRGEVEIKEGPTNIQKQIDKIVKNTDPSLQYGSTNSIMPLTTILSKSGVSINSWSGMVKYFLSSLIDLGIYYPLASGQSNPSQNKISIPGVPETSKLLQNTRAFKTQSTSQILNIINSFIESGKNQISVTTINNKQLNAYNFDDFFQELQTNGYIDLSGVSKIKIDSSSIPISASSKPSAVDVVTGVTFYVQDSNESQKIYFLEVLENIKKIFDLLKEGSRSETGTVITNNNGTSLVLPNKTPTITLTAVPTNTPTESLSNTQTLSNTKTTSESMTGTSSKTSSISLTYSDTLTDSGSLTPSGSLTVTIIDTPTATNITIDSEIPNISTDSSSKTETLTESLTETTTSSYIYNLTSQQTHELIKTMSATKTITPEISEYIKNITSNNTIIGFNSTTKTTTLSPTETESQTNSVKKTINYSPTNKTLTTSVTLTNPVSLTSSETIAVNVSDTNTASPTNSKIDSKIPNISTDSSSKTETLTESPTKTLSQTNSVKKTINYSPTNKTLTTSVTLTKTNPIDSSQTESLTFTNTASLTNSASNSLSTKIESHTNTASLTSELTASLTKTIEITSTINGSIPIENRITEINCRNNEQGDVSFSCQSVNGDYFKFNCQTKEDNNQQIEFNCNGDERGIINSLNITFNKTSGEIEINNPEFSEDSKLNDKEKNGLLTNIKGVVAEIVKTYETGDKDRLKKSEPIIIGLASTLGGIGLVALCCCAAYVCHSKQQKRDLTYQVPLTEELSPIYGPYAELPETSTIGQVEFSSTDPERNLQQITPKQDTGATPNPLDIGSSRHKKPGTKATPNLLDRGFRGHHVTATPNPLNVGSRRRSASQPVKPSIASRELHFLDIGLPKATGQEKLLTPTSTERQEESQQGRVGQQFNITPSGSSDDTLVAQIGNPLTSPYSRKSGQFLSPLPSIVAARLSSSDLKLEVTFGPEEIGLQPKEGEKEKDHDTQDSFNSDGSPKSRLPLHQKMQKGAKNSEDVELKRPTSKESVPEKPREGSPTQSTGSPNTSFAPGTEVNLLKEERGSSQERSS